MAEDGAAAHYAQADADRIWSGFTRAEALAWSRVLRRHWPSWPGMLAMRAISVGLEQGFPAALEDWALRARQAEAIGFTPDLYDRLHTALDAIPPFEHPAHPDNHPDPRWPVHTVRVFTPAAWSDWPWLIEAGWADEEAAELLLAAGELQDAP